MTTIQNLIDAYVADLKSSGVAKSTVSNYAQCLKFFGGVDGQETPAMFDVSRLHNYEALLMHKLAAKPELLALRYLKSLLYLVQWVETNGNSFGVNSSTIRKRVSYYERRTQEWQRSYNKPYISEGELNKLKLYWQKNTDVATLYALRNRAILSILGDTGIKVSELMNLNRIDFVEPYLILNNRKVRVTGRTRYLMQHYLEVRPDKAAPMFVGYRDIQADKVVTQPLGIRSIQRIVAETGEEVGIDKKVSPQILRNSRMIRAIAVDKMSYKEMTHYFGLSKTNTSYQRFLKQAQDFSALSTDTSPSSI